MTERSATSSRFCRRGDLWILVGTRNVLGPWNRGTVERRIDENQVGYGKEREDHERRCLVRLDELISKFNLARKSVYVLSGIKNTHLFVVL